jgi:beta-glucanase (GH16 family)
MGLMIMKKNKLFIVLLICQLTVFCSHKDSGVTDDSDNSTVADFVVIKKNTTDSTNYFVFTSTAQGSYKHLEWVFPEETLQNDTIFTYYFPKKGTYTVKLCLIQTDGGSVTASKTVSVATDDPNYVPNKLIWSDEFDGDTLNTSNWSNETDIDVNNEWEKYTNGTNLKIKDGILTITAKLVGTGQNKYDYTSGRVNSYGKREFLYGRMEIRAKMPVGRGTWPATWMLGANIGSVSWPACGELDIMEHVGYDPTWIQGSIHSPSSYGSTVNYGRFKVSDCESAFHIYGMTWTPEKISYFVDDPDDPYYTYNPSYKDDSTWPFHKPCFFILNLAIGGSWGGLAGVDDSIFPVDMQIDYVRVYNYK